MNEQEEINLRDNELVRDTMHLENENLWMLETLETISDRIEFLRKYHPELITPVIDAKLEITLQQLKHAKLDLNDLGKVIDKATYRALLAQENPNRYKSIEASKKLVAGEDQYHYLLMFPNNVWQKSTKLILHSKKYITPTQNENGIIINYYPTWSFEVFDADPLTGKKIQNVAPDVIDQVDFAEMVYSANMVYSYEPLVVGRKNLLTNSPKMKPSGMHM